MNNATQRKENTMNANDKNDAQFETDVRHVEGILANWFARKYEDAARFAEHFNAVSERLEDAFNEEADVEMLNRAELAVSAARLVIKHNMPKTREIEVGSFIMIPAWQTMGCVTEVRLATIGDDSAVDIKLQEDPESNRTRNFRIENGQFDWA
jgi:hypothetical protein